jgi:hypothetical protein
LGWSSGSLLIAFAASDEKEIKIDEEGACGKCLPKFQWSASLRQARSLALLARGFASTSPSLGLMGRRVRISTARRAPQEQMGTRLSHSQ